MVPTSSTSITLLLGDCIASTIMHQKKFSREILIDYLSSFFDPDRLQKLNTGLLGSISLLVEYLKKNKNLFLDHFDIPEQVELSNIMTIDPSTRKNLEINTSLDGEKKSFPLRCGR